MSLSSLSLASRLLFTSLPHHYSNIQTSRPAAVCGSHCAHRAHAARDGMFHNCYACRSAGYTRYRHLSGQSRGSLGDVVRRIATPRRAFVAHRISRISRSALRFLDPPLLSAQRAAPSPPRPRSCTRDLPGTQRRSRRTNQEGGKCCECVTRVRNWRVASDSGPCNACALMEHSDIPADAHATNDAMHVTAHSRAAEVAQVRQTIRSTHDAYGPRRRSRSGIRPVHADSSMNQNPPPPSAPSIRTPPPPLAARGISADGSRLA
ncbi:hypothetical protein BLA13014_04315 [Burkholderia aenigmatica]|uniref:Uncharacterized protein n=1 Tax=Burkholderia aenigmatica TaxID=2015348 RepID=A0A6P2NFP4_9BURK|nr:hypothetical protein BLA13014_04315 [Burkholderia aenigmatica]